MKKYVFGDCIPESIKIYNKLKIQGKHPKLVEGWVEVDYNDLEPNRDFLELYYPDIMHDIDNDLECNDYTRVFPHTWILYRGKIIDITKNQFDKFGGIIRYFEKGRYYYKGRYKINLTDLDLGANEVWEDTNCIHYN